MSYEPETDYSPAHYRCVDPIENLRIKIILQPVKSLYIPLPLFDVKHTSSEISSDHEEKEVEKEEYTFRWQEKILSRKEVARISAEADWRKKLTEKYDICSTNRINHPQDYSTKIFSYVEIDNYSVSESNLQIFREKNNHVTFLSQKMNNLHLPKQYVKNYKNVAKRNVINYYPSKEFKNQAHLFSNNIQRMFIMIDSSSELKKEKNTENEENDEGVLCTLIYDYSNNVLQMTPSFTKSKLKPYIYGVQNQDSENSYYYWIYHTSLDIPTEALTKEINIMSKMYEHQEQLRKLQIDTKFFIGKPDHVYITVLCEIISAEGFEYDNLHIHYFMKLPSEWSYSDTDLLTGRTQTSYRNRNRIWHFSHLFEMNFCLELKLLEDLSAPLPELFFEVLSVDSYNRYRNEGYTYITIPRRPGMYNYTLKCWRVVDNSIKSRLSRFFIGGGVELEDVSCIGLSPAENGKVMSRFGTETVPEGDIKIRLSILHQCKAFSKKSALPEVERNIICNVDSGSLLGSVNTVLEAFRRARERMLNAKKGLQTDLNYIFPKDRQDEGDKNDVD